jgi:hypothetical protein
MKSLLIAIDPTYIPFDSESDVTQEMAGKQAWSKKRMMDRTRVYIDLPCEGRLES